MGHDVLAINGGPKAVQLESRENWKKIQQEEIDLVVEMLEREEISAAGFGVMREFEEEFRDFEGTRYALSQCSGTSTLEAAYFAVGVGPGDEVIVPSYTWQAQIGPIIHNNAVPVFCEIDPHTLTADPDDIRRKITSRTKAISIVHIWGNVADMDAIMQISDEFGIPVIEDCSHAHGAEFDGKKVGSIGAVGCFSLQGSKPLTAGEGGVVVTSNTEYYERILIYGHAGRISRDLVTDKYRFLGDPGLGYKHRAHPLAMGIAKVQLSRIDQVNALRTRSVQILDEGLCDIPGVSVVQVHPKAKRGGLYEYRAIYEPKELDGLPREKFIDALRAEGVWIETCRYRLWHKHPAFNGYSLRNGCPFYCPYGNGYEPLKEGALPVTEDVYNRLLTIPVFTQPPEGLYEQYVDAFQKVTRNIEQLDRV